jgi:hypothetical protein
METGEQSDNSRASDRRIREASELSVSSAVEQAKKTVSGETARIKDRARHVAEQQKAAGADRIGGVAEAMEATANDLQDKMPLAAEYIEDVAGRLETMASTLREGSVGDVVGNVTDFARRRPAAFFAGAVAAGFAMSRFLKSSANRAE